MIEVETFVLDEFLLSRVLTGTNIKSLYTCTRNSPPLFLTHNPSSVRKGPLREEIDFGKALNKALT